jgi:hypothetical protein
MLRGQCVFALQRCFCNRIEIEAAGERGAGGPWRRGSVMRASNRRFCSASPTSQPVLDEHDAIEDVSLELGADQEKALMLRLRAEPHDILDARPVVPAAIEDHDFARRREVRDNTLEYSCDFSRSDGTGSATTRNTRGLPRWVIACSRRACRLKSLVWSFSPLETRTRPHTDLRR